MKRKINLSIIFVSLIAVITTAAGILYECYDLFRKEVQSDLMIEADILKELDIFEDGCLDENSKLFMDLSYKNIRITWIDEEGNVLYDNVEDNLSNHLDRPEIKEALNNGESQVIRKSDTSNLDTFYYATKLENETVLRVSKDVQTISSVFMTSLPMVLIGVFIVCMVCVLISSILTRQLIDPLNKMAENLDAVKIPEDYKELVPFANKIKIQHEKILMAAKVRQDFTANVSHELKTPLTAISGYAELIENDMVDSSDIQNVATKIRENAKRLILLINDTIRLSELDQNEFMKEFEEFDLLVYTKEICNEMSVMASNKQIQITCKGNSTKLKADKELIHELIVNLIQNSIQYTNEKGEIKVNVYTDEGKPVFEIIDNGIGIPKEAQSRIFERFYRVDKSHSRQTGGTGLGLAIVKHIVEIHDAKIILHSELNKGTEIKVVF